MGIKRMNQKVMTNTTSVTLKFYQYNVTLQEWKGPGGIKDRSAESKNNPCIYGLFLKASLVTQGKKLAVIKDALTLEA